MTTSSLLAAVQAAADPSPAPVAPPSAPTPAASADAVDAAHRAAALEAVKADRARVSTILTHADAAGFEDLANHLAFDTDLSAESAVAMLAKAQKATATGATIDALRATAPAISIGSDARDPKAADKPKDLSAAVDRFNAQRKR